MATLLKVNNNPNPYQIGIGSGYSPPPQPGINISTPKGVVQTRYVAPPAPSLQHPTWGAPPPPPSILSSALHLGGSLISPASNLIRTDITNPLRVTAAQFTHNKQALANANAAQNKAISADINNARQFVTKPVAEVATTIAHPFTQHTYQPNTKLQKALFGSQPIQNIQKKVANNYDTHPGLNPLARIGLATGEAVGSLAQDVPVVGTEAKIIGKGIKAAHDIPKNELGAAGKNVNKNGTPAQSRTGSLGIEGPSGNPPAGAKPVIKPSGEPPTPRMNLNPSKTDLKMPPDFLRSSSVPHPGPASSRNAVTSRIFPQGLPELPLKLRQSEENLSKDSISQPPQKTGTQKTFASSNNPTKVEIGQVKSGDYAKARSNAQLASNPIEYAGGQAAKAAQGLSSSRLGKLVEGTISPANAKEAEAVLRYRQLADRTHATSQALGGDTPYIKNYFRHQWDLSNPEDAARFQSLINSRGGSALDPYAFGGIDKMPRVFKSVAEGEAKGFKLKNPKAADEILAYSKASASALKRQALAKGITEADMSEAIKNRSFDLANGQTLPVSERGLHELRSFEQPHQAGKVLSGYRATNRGLKQTLLSASEFHPINISLLKAGPAEALSGHPVLAAKGVYGSFRGQIGKGYSDRLQQHAQETGVIDAAARIGTPIKSGTDYSAEGKLNIGKAGIGEKTIFEKSMPAMHIRMVQGAIKDLQKKGISLDSPEARKAGLAINKTMGFINKEVSNLDPRAQKALSDLALAPQFTRAKWSLLKDAFTQRGLGGKYARRAVIGNTAAVTAVSLGLGYLLHQKTDSIKDTLIRNLIHPSVPTPFKDKKGNTVELGMPSTYISEAAGLGANLKRNNNGSLGINLNPKNIPANLENYGRARLAVVPSSALKVATNTDYANKPLFDPNAPAGTKAQQATATLLGGLAPIGTQGLLQTNAIKSHLPQGVQQVLNANAPGSNPLLKSLGSSFGLTPRTDKTVGKGLQTTQYYDALSQASQGLNRQEKDALDILTGGKKNPVTGAYDISPNANDSSTKAKLLLQNPKVIDRLITLNQTLASQGQKVDPLWLQSKDQITKAMQYATMPPGGNDRTIWEQANGSWYNPLQTQRNAFFNTLPAADPNKPKNPIAYPTAPPQIQTLEDKFFAATDPKIQSQMIKDNPGLIQQFQAQHDYTNKLREAQGYSPLNGAPQATDYVQKLLDSVPSGTDTASKKAASAIYKDPQVAQFLQNVSVYNLAKNSALAQYQGQTLNQKALKAISSVGQYDIVKNPDGTLALNGSSDIQSGAKGVGFNSSLKASTGSTGRGRKTGVGSRGGKAKLAKITTPKIKLAKTPTVRVKLGPKFRKSTTSGYTTHQIAVKRASRTPKGFNLA